MHRVVVLLILFPFAIACSDGAPAANALFSTPGEFTFLEQFLLKKTPATTICPDALDCDSNHCKPLGGVLPTGNWGADGPTTAGVYPFEQAIVTDDFAGVGSFFLCEYSGGAEYSCFINPKYSENSVLKDNSNFKPTFFPRQQKTWLACNSADPKDCAVFHD